MYDKNRRNTSFPNSHNSEKQFATRPLSRTRRKDKKYKKSLNSIFTSSQVSHMTGILLPAVGDFREWSKVDKRKRLRNCHDIKGQFIASILLFSMVVNERLTRNGLRSSKTLNRFKWREMYLH